jgi:hypothetical protein
MNQREKVSHYSTMYHWGGSKPLFINESIKHSSPIYVNESNKNKQSLESY